MPFMMDPIDESYRTHVDRKPAIAAPGGAIEGVAAKLSVPQRQYLTLYAEQRGDGWFIAPPIRSWHTLRFLERHELIDCFARITDRGMSVRAHLKSQEQPHG